MIKRAYFATDFLERMYRTHPRRARQVPRRRPPSLLLLYKELTPEIEEVRAALKRERDPGRSIWLTELGWSSGKPEAANGNNQFEKGSQGQARELTGAFKLLKAKAATWRVKRLYWFSFTDAPGTCNFCDGSGLFGPGFVGKPAWAAYERLAR